MKQTTRFMFLTAIFFAGFVFTAVKMIQCTLLPDKRLSAVNYRIKSPRGNIYDARGRLLAGVSTTSSLYARPDIMSEELKDYIKFYLLETGFFSESDVSNFDRTDRNFVYIKRDMTPSISAPAEALFNALKKEGLIRKDELGITTEESRFYPYPFLSPVVGVLGRDGAGLHGIEYTQNEILDKGYSVKLAIDAEISRIAHEELNRVVQESGAEGGSVGIIDIKTRNILSLVHIGGVSDRSGAVSHIYEPGSVMKMFSAAFAMEQGLASTESPDFDDYSPYKIGSYTFSQPRYGYIPLSEMLTRSANISFARLSSLFSEDDYYLWLSELGFGKRADLPINGIERGILHDTKSWTALSKPMISIGQEIGVTTLQLLIAASVIGGHGLYVDPRIILSVQSPEGEVITIENSDNPKQIFHPQKAKELLYTLENVIDRGTGRQAAIEGVRVAGKTGTGMIAGAEGYGVGRNNTVFAGIFPVDNPSVAIVVAIHNPKGDTRSGGGVSAPLFSNIARRMLISATYLQ